MSRGGVGCWVWYSGGLWFGYAICVVVVGPPAWDMGIWQIVVLSVHGVVEMSDRCLVVALVAGFGTVVGCGLGM